MKKYLLLSLAMAVSLPAYAALDCATPPTCDELGYTQTETDCAGKFMLKCPFSDEDFFCGGEIASCSDLGYTSTVTSGKTFCLTGSTAEYCPSDSTYYKCVESATYTQCKNAGYTQTRCLIGCTTTTCPYDSNYMKCTNCPTTSATTCPSGYYKSGADELCDCTYGRYYDGTRASDGTACYRCGTYNECNVGVGQTCVRCSIDALVPAL